MLARSNFKKVLSAVLLAAVIVVPLRKAAVSCTAIIAGGNTTADGSILFGKTEDDRAGDVDYLWYIPERDHGEGAMVKLTGGGEVPQAATTYGYFFDQNPGTEWSNAVVNQWGLALGSNACRSREVELEEAAKRGLLTDGGIGWRLRIILAERCRTAREAVEMAAGLLDKYGYRGSGRNLSIVGRKEAWILQMVRGRQYAARRVRDDEVVPVPNCYTIRRIDFDDDDNFIYSPGLVEYAVERGWYDSERDGEFDFARVYSLPENLTGTYNTRRFWMMARMVNHDFPLSWKEADEGKMPVSVKPDRKLTVKDIMAVMRTHFEGTDLDDSRRSGESPHSNENRPVCTYRTHRTTVVQQRDWMPPAIGTVVWRALYYPCSSGFVPWYLCATDIPEAFRKAPDDLYESEKDLLDFHFGMTEVSGKMDMESASCVFGVMAGLVDSDYHSIIEYVQRQWSGFEDYQFAVQPVIEETALELYDEDRRAARVYLSQYTRARALKSLELARSIIDTIEKRYWKAERGEKAAP